MRILLLASSFVLMSVASQAAPSYPDLFAIDVQPGEYTGYLDWAAKERWHMPGKPSPIVRDFMVCAANVAYTKLMFQDEQQMVDSAAQWNGFGSANEQLLGEKFDRHITKEKFLQTIQNECRKEYEAVESAS